eukprot:6903311-Lingulodinium_polyedra.AAC.1
MSIVRMGMCLGVYKSYKDCPFWGVPSQRRRGQPQAAGATQEQEQEQQKEQQARKDKAAAAAVAAKAKAEAPSSTSEPYKGGGDHLMKTEGDTEAALRKACSNSLFVIGAILSRGGAPEPG